MTLLRLGVSLQPRWPLDDGTAVLRTAIHAEDLGFDHVAVGNRLLDSGFGLDTDPLVLLSAVAGVTTRLRFQGGSCVRQQEFPERCGADRHAAVDQLAVDFTLQRGERVRHRGLTHAERFRRSSEALVVHDRREHGQLLRPQPPTAARQRARHHHHRRRPNRAGHPARPRRRPLYWRAGTSQVIGGLAPVKTTPAVLAGILILGVAGTGLAYILNTRVIAAWGATTAATVTYLTPLVGVVLGVVVLGESLHWNEPAGGALVILGVLISQGRITMRRRQPLPDLAAPRRSRELAS